MDLGLKGKRALVLGASKGLGRGTAEALGKEGVRLVLVSRTAEVLKATRDDLKNQGMEVEILAADIGQIDALLEKVDAEIEKGGEFDILVNNTGGPPACPAAHIPRKVWRESFEAMVLPLFSLTDHLLPAMVKSGWGRIITIASTGIIQPIPNLALSNSLRNALAGWSKTLASEVASDGVTVNIVMPGRIETDRIVSLDKNRAKKANLTFEEIRKNLMASIPAGRHGTIEEFGAVVAFLASRQASYITGSRIRVDGGAVLGL